MPRTRNSNSPRLNRDASRLVALALALNSSGSRVEDRYWEGQLAQILVKLMRGGNDAPLEAALDHLSQANPGAYEVLIEQAETLSESCVLEKDGQRHDVLLIVAPLVAWTRYTIPAGPIPRAALDALAAQLHGHVLAADARLALLPRLVSIDQMPRSFSDTWQWLHRLGQQALGGDGPRPASFGGEAETANMLADTRYVVGAVAAPEHQPLFRWQEAPGEHDAGRQASLEQWIAQARPTLTQLLPGCGFECLLPDAYYVSNREADRRVRPLALKAAISWLESSLSLPPAQLRAVIGGCGETRVDEYRIGFTPRNRNDVIYGCVWPLYGREDEAPAGEDEVQPDIADEIAALLKEQGVTDIRRLPGLLPPDYCEDCGAPHFPNPLGEMVHAELPEDADTAPAHFH